MDKLTECKYKCSYTFNYNVSNLNMSHKGDYIQINYDRTSGKQVVYNNNPYSVYDIRLYTKPITNIGDKQNKTTTQGQLVIFHSSNNSSLSLIVIIPIVLSSILGSSLLNDVALEAINNLNSTGDSYSSKLDGFTLENIVPKAPFMAYTAIADFGDGRMDTKYNFIEFNSRKNGYVSLYKDYFEDLKNLINEPKKAVSDMAETGTMAYNKTGPTEISDSNEIYIDCQPVYDNTVEKETVIFKDAEKKITKANQYAKFIFSLIFPLLITLIVFVGLYYGFQRLVGTPPSSAEKLLNTQRVLNNRN